jgi:hypothetical protein
MNAIVDNQLAEITAFLDHLTDTEQFNEAECYHYWPAGHPGAPADSPAYTGTCTVGAAIVAKRFGGSIWGYGENPAATVSPTGHDFAIVGMWLVDWWAYNVEASTPKMIFNLETEGALIASLYGPRKSWEPTPFCEPFAVKP